MSNTLIIALLIIFSIFSFLIGLGKYSLANLNHTKLKYMVQKGHKKAEKLATKLETNDSLYVTAILSKLLFDVAIVILYTFYFKNDLSFSSFFVVFIVAFSVQLILLELTPRLFAKKFSESLSLFFMPLFEVLFYLWIPYSLVALLWNKAFVKLLKINRRGVISEDELLNIVDEAEQDGSINTSEGDLIRSVFDFDDLKVIDIFTPRVDLIAVDIKTPIAKIITTFKKSGYSRIPIFEESVDHIIGIINHKDFYNSVVLEKRALDTIIKEPVFVTEYMKVSALLELLKNHKAHMAIVKDEFGGTVGIVTMEDILEELVGDIWDEHDEIVEQIIKLSEFEYRVKGNAEVEDLFELLNLDIELDHITVNGWVSEELGKIAEVGDTFKYQNIVVIVTQADQKKVNEILIKVNEDE